MPLPSPIPRLGRASGAVVADLSNARLDVVEYVAGAETIRLNVRGADNDDCRFSGIEGDSWAGAEVRVDVGMKCEIARPAPDPGAVVIVVFSTTSFLRSIMFGGM